MFKEGTGEHNGQPVYCTVNGWDCPYYHKGICYIENPVEDCEDFNTFFETWEDWEDA